MLQPRPRHAGLAENVPDDSRYTVYVDAFRLHMHVTHLLVLNANSKLAQTSKPFLDIVQKHPLCRLRKAQRLGTTHQRCLLACRQPSSRSLSPLVPLSSQAIQLAIVSSILLSPVHRIPHSLSPSVRPFLRSRETSTHSLQSAGKLRILLLDLELGSGGLGVGESVDDLALGS